MLTSPDAHHRAPVLETARLRLRPHGLDDFENCAALWADPQVTRYIGGRPLSREEAWTRLLRYAGHWALLGFGYWVAESKETGYFVGELGFADYKRDIEPPLEGLPEAGWVFAPSAQGKGYATEAVHAITLWGETHFRSGQTTCLIHPGNAASIRVANKCGFREFRRTTYKGEDTILFMRDSTSQLKG